LKKTTDKEKQ
jgi:chromosome segregation ATPase